MAIHSALENTGGRRLPFRPAFSSLPAVAPVDFRLPVSLSPSRWRFERASLRFGRKDTLRSRPALRFRGFSSDIRVITHP